MQRPFSRALLTRPQLPHRGVSIPLLSAFVSGVVLLAGCGGTSSGSSNGTSSSQTSIRIVLPTVVSGDELDPDIATGYELNFVENVFDTLFKFDRNGTPQPNIATSDVVSDSGLVHTLTIRQGVVFQNGAKLTSADVVFSLEREQGLLPGENKLLASQSNTHITSVSAPTPTTVVIHLASPDPALDNDLAFENGMVVPEAYIEKVGDSGFWNHPIGSGPYEFVSQVPGQSITIKRFPGYIGSRPAIGQVTFIFNTNQAARVAEVESGAADMALDADPSQVASIKSHGLKTVGLSIGNVQDIDFNYKSDDFTNPAIGEAFNLAIDRVAIIKNILHGYGTLAASLDPEQRTIDTGLSPFPYDPAKAKKLLQSAGFDFNSPLTMSIPIGRWTDATSVAATVVGELQQIGVHVTIDNMDLATWAQKNATDSLGVDLNMSGTPNSYFDPIPQWSNFECQQPYSMWCDRKLTDMITAAGQLSGSARRAAIRGIDVYMRSHPPAVFLYQIQEVEVMTPKLSWNPLQGAAYIRLTDLS
jgi:peptide/nickel transport system substrate-binding protein